jgi:phosphatidylserine decarboxylase
LRASTRWADAKPRATNCIVATPLFRKAEAHFRKSVRRAARQNPRRPGLATPEAPGRRFRNAGSTSHDNVTCSAHSGQESVIRLKPTSARLAQGSTASSGESVAPLPRLGRFFLREDLNFLLTNRIPRRQATLFMGWFSRIESPLLARLSIAVWRLFADDLRLHEAKRTDFRSLHDCFIRELRPGSRPIDPDPDVIVSPCDAVVGAYGRIEGARVFQAKHFPYTLLDLLGDRVLADRHRDGLFVTLRLKANMYHRFHAPMDARIERIRYLSGDTWNVNPIALKRVEKLFCKNERAIVEFGLPNPREVLTIVPVASILVASIKLHVVDGVLDLRYRGPHDIVLKDVSVTKGEELGFFQSGSTIIAFASGPFGFSDNVREGATVRVGQALLRRQESQPFQQ